MLPNFHLKFFPVYLQGQIFDASDCIRYITVNLKCAVPEYCLKILNISFFSWKKKPTKTHKTKKITQ